MMMHVFGLFFLLVAVSLAVISAICVVTFRRDDVAGRQRRMSVEGFFRKPHDYLRKPFGTLAWGLGVLAVLSALAGAVMLLFHLTHSA
jgi:hypothetical protein